MRGIVGFLGGSAVVGLFLWAAVAQAEKIALDKVPPKVMAAVKDRFPGAEVTSAEKETAFSQ